MNLIHQGGMMIWPLIFLSIPALGAILERFVFFFSHPFPVSGDCSPKDRKEADLFSPFFEALASKIPPEQKEEKAAMAAKKIIFLFGRRLDFLSSVAATAPLIGLLGTVVGMVQAFSKLAGAGSGAMDITLLAGGIWHALLTTAAGLVIAIPSLMAHQWFSSRTTDIAFKMECYANRIIGESGTGHD